MISLCLGVVVATFTYLVLSSLICSLVAGHWIKPWDFVMNPIYQFHLDCIRLAESIGDIESANSYRQDLQWIEFINLSCSSVSLAFSIAVVIGLLFL